VRSDYGQGIFLCMSETVSLEDGFHRFMKFDLFSKKKKKKSTPEQYTGFKLVNSNKGDPICIPLPSDLHFSSWSLQEA
jgi:hypothetical protein